MTNQETTPQDASPLQGDGEREPVDIKKVHGVARSLGWGPGQCAGHHASDALIIHAAANELESLRAERQAWEEERAELKDEAAYLRIRADENDRRRWARLPEEHPDGGETWEERAEEHAAALASLREENARLKAEFERVQADALRRLAEVGEAGRAMHEASKRFAAKDMEGVRQLLCDMNAKTQAAALRRAHDQAAEAMQAESARLRARVEELEGVKDGAYAERNKLVAALSKVLPSYLGMHPSTDADWEDDWRHIVFIDAPTGQLSWHLHDSEVTSFSHLEVRPGEHWDGHSTDEKYERLAALSSLGEPQGEEVRGE